MSDSILYIPWERLIALAVERIPAPMLGLDLAEAEPVEEPEQPE